MTQIAPAEPGHELLAYYAPDEQPPFIVRLPITAWEIKKGAATPLPVNVVDLPLTEYQTESDGTYSLLPERRPASDFAPLPPRRPLSDFAPRKS
jgi:hypothetical protein